MLSFDILLQNLLTPAPLFFVLGVFAGYLKSDLEVPDSISRYLSIYLMIAIGFKGGVSISQCDCFDRDVMLMIMAGVFVSFLQPWLSYFLLRKTTNLSGVNAAAVSAHYGSVSIATFAAAVSFLRSSDVSYSGYIVGVLALMEAPAILSGLLIAYGFIAKESGYFNQNQLVGAGSFLTKEMIVHKIFTNGAILLLLGSFVIGFITGLDGLAKLSGFLDAPFQGILCLFLLDIGLLVSRNLHLVRSFSFPLFCFGIYMPILGALFGLLITAYFSINLGTSFLFMVLCASSSYIAVPAAMRLALPQADSSIYLPMSIAITFPFNIIIGIPIYYKLAKFYCI